MKQFEELTKFELTLFMLFRRIATFSYLKESKGAAYFKERGYEDRYFYVHYFINEILKPEEGRGELKRMAWEWGKRCVARAEHPAYTDETCEYFTKYVLDKIKY